MRFTPPSKRGETERVLKTTLSEMSGVLRAGPSSSSAEASTSSGLTALDLMKRQRDALEAEIRRRQHTSEAAEGKSADPPPDRPIDAAPRCKWEENKDLSVKEFYSKYFDRGMPEGSKPAPESSSSGGLLERLPTDLRMRIGQHLDEESLLEFQRTNRDARYRLFGGKQVWDQFRAVTRRQRIRDRWNEFQQLVFRARRQPDGRILREGLGENEEYADRDDEAYWAMVGRVKEGAILWWYRVHHLREPGMSKRTLAREFAVGQDRLPEQAEEWGTVDWEELVDDSMLALARLVWKNKIDMDTAWNIFAYMTQYSRGPTT